MLAEDIERALLPTGMCDADMIATVRHLMLADELGIHDQGVEARVEWLADMRFPGKWPIKCELLPYTKHTWHVTGQDHIGYGLMQAAVNYPFIPNPAMIAPQMVIVDNCFPSGALGIWARMLADRGFASIITATSPRRVPHPDGMKPQTGTTPLCVCVPADTMGPNDGGDHLVADLSLTEFTYGDVLLDRVNEDALFFRDRRMWALAIALETMVRSMSYANSAVLMLLFHPVSSQAVAVERAFSQFRLPGERREETDLSDPRSR